MARLARVLAPGLPHHVTQRGNRRQTVFFSDEDYEAYKALVAEHCAAAQVAVWAYCLMPNHVHLILVPPDEDGLRRALGEAHRRYTRRINFREGWRGYLWQGRFASFVMDERASAGRRALRGAEPGARRARARGREDWPWSSAAAHLAARDDGLVTVAPLLEIAGDWRALLDGGLDEAALAAIRAHERTGRPLGSEAFLDELEARLGRILKKRRAGRKSVKTSG